MKEEILKIIDNEIEFLTETRKCHSSPPTRYYLEKQIEAIRVLREKVSQMQLPVKPANDGNIFEMNIYTGRVNGNDIHQKEEQHILFTARSKKQIEYLINELCRVIRQTDKINTHNEIIAGIIGDANRLSV